MFLPVKHRSINTHMNLCTLSTFPASAFPLCFVWRNLILRLSSASLSLSTSGCGGLAPPGGAVWLRSISVEERRVKGGKLLK